MLGTEENSTLVLPKTLECNLTTLIIAPLDENSLLGVFNSTFLCIWTVNSEHARNEHVDSLLSDDS